MRNYSIDTLKLICAIIVIYAHTPQTAICKIGLTPLTHCVCPIFFMISGYLTYGKENLDTLLRKRFINTFKIFFKIFIFYFLCFIIANGKDSLEHLSILFSYNFLLFNQVPFGMHLWYILAYLYVLYIMLFVNKYNFFKSLFYITPILLVTALIIGKYSEITLNCILPNYTRNFLFTGLPFFAIGMMIKHIKYRPSKYITIILCLLFYISSIIEICNFFGTGDWCISTIFLSISAFYLCLNIRQNNDNIFSKTGREDSLYIYLFHYAFAAFLSVVAHRIPYLPYYSAPLVFCATMILVKLLKKLKIIGRII